jgi:hypothetical protein
MKRVLGLAILLLWLTTCGKELSSVKGKAGDTQAPAEEGFRITEPKGGDEVPVSATIRGVTDNPDDKIWVVVFPVGLLAPGTTRYWVQVQAIVNKQDGTWSCSPVFFGEPGKHDGKLFEFRAVANPKSALQPGDILPEYPEAEKQTKNVSVKGGP